MRHKRRARPVRIPLPLQRKQFIIKPFRDLLGWRKHLIRRMARELNNLNWIRPLRWLRDRTRGLQAAEGVFEG